MAFQPDKIKREHILKAIKSIKDGNQNVKASTKYDIIFEGNTYPPKEVIRLAHQFATGEYVWKKSGGEPTNSYIRALGFEVINKGKEEKQNTNYWIFQGNPEIFDFETALSENSLNNFTVSAHKNNIKIGNKVIIWLSGKNAGCYALAEVTSEPSVNQDSKDDVHWKVENKNQLKAGIQVTHNLINSPVLWESIKKHPDFTAFKAGNQGSNFRATQQEYNSILVMANQNQYTWVQTHKDIVQFLKTQKENQLGLIDLLQSLGINPFNDQDIDGQQIPLQEIDPFTFFAYIYKYGGVKRLKLLQKLAEKLSAHYPTDEKGIPSANAQKVWFFPYKDIRHNNEVEKLWEFFFSALDHSITNELFAEVLQIKNVGLTKITEGLFYIMPEVYFPVNGPTRPFLEHKLGIDPKFNNYTEYKAILEQLKAKSNKPFYQLSYEAWHWNDHFQNSEVSPNNTSTMQTPINQLFFGPPGTGKTYSTIAEAVKIIDRDFYEANKNDRDALVKRYRESIITDWENTKGQIAFCTFHQSFTYEDFVEGIKPKTTQEKNIYYDVEPGIFKRICDLAQSSKSSNKVKTEGKFNWSHSDFRNAFFYKISLGEANNPQDKEIFEFCKENGYIAIGFGGAIDYAGKSESEIKELCKDNDPNDSAGSQLSAFIHGLSVGDYVIVSKGNSYVRAIGKVVGEYEYHDDFPIDYNHFRKVEWVMIDNVIPVKDLYYKKFSQRSIYKLNHNEIREDFFVQENDTLLYSEDVEENIKPYVIIIDEINRGNVSSIFGELITLIEPDKRAGANEELKVILPYSKEEFSVPDNVYIIGTMNTADRSIEALDSALRRRFNFKEINPKPNKIDELLEDKATWKSIRLSDVLTKINSRITLLIDKDHQIGHSYFLKLKDTTSADYVADLKNIFKSNIIPLLQEYFFNDYIKIGMVLGTGFIQIKDQEESPFAEIENTLEDDYSDTKDFMFIDLDQLSDEEFEEALMRLLN